MTIKRHHEQPSKNALSWSVMDVLLDEVVLVDSKGEILWVNQAWRTFASENGADERTLLGVGMNYFDVCYKASQEGDAVAKEVREGLLAVSQGNLAEYEIEYPCRTPQAELWFRMRAVRLSGKNAPLIIAHHNISERIRTENAFLNEADRFYSLVNSMSDIVFLLDTQGRHIGIYGQWLRHYGLKEDMFIGKTAREILGDEAAKVHEEANARVLAGEHVLYEWSYHDQNGEHIIQTHLSPMRDISGRIQGIVGVGRDLTERVKHERFVEDHMRKRLRELEAIHSLSKSLRNANTSDEMVEELLAEIGRLLEIEAGSVWLYDPVLMKLTPRSVLGWFREIRQDPLLPGEGLVGWVFEQGQLLWSDEFVRDERASASFRLQAQEGWGGVVLPLTSKEEVLGAFVVAYPTERPLCEEELQILNAFSELTCNALQRARAMELLERRVQQLLSLRTIDNAISSSLDLALTLDILLEQVLAHVYAEAADILLYDPLMHSFKLVASRGYRSTSLGPLNLSINNGVLAQLVNDRQMVVTLDVAEMRSMAPAKRFLGAKASTVMWQFLY